MKISTGLQIACQGIGKENLGGNQSKCNFKHCGTQCCPTLICPKKGISLAAHCTGS